MIYKRGKWYWMDAVVNGARYRVPLKTKNWQAAKQLEKDELKAIADGKRGRRGASAPKTLAAASDAYVEYRKLHSAPKTYATDKHFGIKMALAH